MYLTAFYSLPVHWQQRGIPLRMCPASGRDSRGQCVPGGPLSESRILCAGRGWQRCPAARWTAVSSSRPFLPDGIARSAGDSQGHGPGTAHPRKYSPRQRRGSTSAGALLLLYITILPCTSCKNCLLIEIIAKKCGSLLCKMRNPKIGLKTAQNMCAVYGMNLDETA